MLPPQQFRIVSDTGSQPEAYIPVSQDPRSLAILRDLTDPSPETVERRRIEGEAYHVQREAERRAEEQAHLATHAALLVEHAGSPILTALLHAHAPVVNETVGWMECKGCAPQWEERHSEYLPVEGPCPTWLLIKQGA